MKIKVLMMMAVKVIREGTDINLICIDIIMEIITLMTRMNGKGRQ